MAKVRYNKKRTAMKVATGKRSYTHKPKNRVGRKALKKRK